MILIRESQLKSKHELKSEVDANFRALELLVRILRKKGIK